tara:strand:+ start:139 stop:399 length:261 start_codon:yes stop_codon:yes gene_type:complete
MKKNFLINGNNKDLMMLTIINFELMHREDLIMLSNILKENIKYKPGVWISYDVKNQQVEIIPLDSKKKISYSYINNDAFLFYSLPS